MTNFGAGVYFLTIVWFITLMLCWVSVRTGHYIGKICVVFSIVITLVLISLPKGDVHESGANFYDKLYVPRYVVLSVLIFSVVVGSAFCFLHVCLAPIETRKIRTFGTDY